MGKLAFYNGLVASTVYAIPIKVSGTFDLSLLLQLITLCFNDIMLPLWKLDSISGVVLNF